MWLRLVQTNTYEESLIILFVRQLATSHLITSIALHQFQRWASESLALSYHRTSECSFVEGRSSPFSPHRSKSYLTWLLALMLIHKAPFARISIGYLPTILDRFGRDKCRSWCATLSLKLSQATLWHPDDTFSQFSHLDKFVDTSSPTIFYF